jgi:hypothetical protein
MSQPEIKVSSSTIEGYTSKDNNDNSAKEDLDSVMGLFENLKIEQKTMDVYKLELLKIKKDVLDVILYINKEETTSFVINFLLDNS